MKPDDNVPSEAAPAVPRVLVISYTRELWHQRYSIHAIIMRDRLGLLYRCDALAGTHALAGSQALAVSHALIGGQPVAASWRRSHIHVYIRIARILQCSSK